MKGYKVVKLCKECKGVYTRNCILSNVPLYETPEGEEREIKQELDRLLNEGYAVRVGATCTGHTLADMVETAGERYIKEHYNVSVIKEYWDYYYLN